MNMKNKDPKVIQDLEQIYSEFDQVMEILGSDKPKSPPPWVVTDILDPKYFDADQILERKKYANEE
jgi:hypothetical protein